MSTIKVDIVSAEGQIWSGEGNLVIAPVAVAVHLVAQPAGEGGRFEGVGVPDEVADRQAEGGAAEAK